MENTPEHVDAAADLAMLDRAKSLVEIDQALDFGPWWNAPILATMIAALTLFNREGAGDWSFVYLAVGVISGTIVTVYNVRRRKVRQRPSVRGTMVGLPIVIGTFVILAAWGTAASSISYDRFVPVGAGIGWLLTTGLLLAVRSGLDVVRDRRGMIG